MSLSAPISKPLQHQRGHRYALSFVWRNWHVLDPTLCPACSHLPSGHMYEGPLDARPVKAPNHPGLAPALGLGLGLGLVLTLGVMTMISPANPSLAGFWTAARPLGGTLEVTTPQRFAPDSCGHPSLQASLLLPQLQATAQHAPWAAKASTAWQGSPIVALQAWRLRSPLPVAGTVLLLTVGLAALARILSSSRRPAALSFAFMGRPAGPSAARAPLRPSTAHFVESRSRMETRLWAARAASGSASETAADLLFQAQAPRPIAFPRKRLRLRLAILLLRSTYEAVDSAQVLSEEDFQKRFFFERQSQWQSYRNLYSPQRIDQGDLADPLYFDYIAAAQWLTISKLLDDAETLPRIYERTEYVPPNEDSDFEEQWVKKVTERNPALLTTAALRKYVPRAMGDNVLRMAETDFADAELAVPAPCPARGDITKCVYEGAKLILQSLVDGGYALKVNVGLLERHGDVGKFTVRLEGPCTLWAAQALRNRRATVSPEIECYVLDAWARRSGAELAWASRIGDSSIERDFRIQV